MIALKYYRPEWVCGRFNSQQRVAICYNLMEGMVYLFEDESAEVINVILHCGRNEENQISDLANQASIEITEIVDFLNELEKLGLVTSECPSKEYIDEYRNNLIEYRKATAYNAIKSLQESSVLINHDDVEMKYMERCGGIFSLMVELTYNCSEKCIHCYNPGATRNDAEESHRTTDNPLSLEEYQNVIDELEAEGLVKVCLTGGDPFSNPIAWKLIEYLWQKEIVIDIFTNGQMLVGKTDKLANFYPRTLGISLYSNIEEVHDSITRIKGSHSKTIKFIEECGKLAMPMLLKCCIMKPNVSSYYTVKEVALNYGMTLQFDLNITDSLDGDICASRFLRLGHKEMEIVLRDPDLPYYINGEKLLDVNKFPMLNEKMCNAGFNSLCLTPSGDIQPCCAFPMKCGNVKNLRIKDILKSPLLTKWRNHNITECTECLKHPYCIFCQLCAGNNFNSTGDYLKASENNCFLAKERYKLSKAMEDGYDPLNGEDLRIKLEGLYHVLPTLHRIEKVKG